MAENVIQRFGEPGRPKHLAGHASLLCPEHLVTVALGDLGTALVIGVAGATAAELASRMFDTPTPQLRQSDWIDALSELGNMLAGKIEGVLGSTRDLGIPAYIDASAKPILWRTLNVKTEVWSSFAGYPIYIAVVTDLPSPSLPSQSPA